METMEEIIRNISSQTGIGEEDIRKRIKEKQRDLSNLISEEGAAYIVAKEHGIELIKKKEYDIKIGNIIAGMKAFNVTARVLKKDDIKEFKTEKAQGKLCPLQIGDETGIIRLILWNDQSDAAENIKRDNLIKIQGAYAKDNLGRVEISVGRSGKIEKVQDSAEIPYADEIEKRFGIESPIAKNHRKRKIKDLREGENARIRACIVSLFENNPFFFTCPDCGMKVKDICEAHGKKEPNLFLSGIIDDGTGNMRAIFFRKNAEKLIGMGTAEAWELFDKTKTASSITCRVALGKDYIFSGFVKKNKLFERMEFVANEVEEVNVKEEIKDLIGLMESQKGSVC